MVAKAVAVLALTSLLSGCTWWSVSLQGSLCTVGPFITDPGATTRLTRAEKEYQVTLNNAGARLCGWTPPSR